MLRRSVVATGAFLSIWLPATRISEGHLNWIDAEHPQCANVSYQPATGNWFAKARLIIRNGGRSDTIETGQEIWEKLYNAGDWDIWHLLNELCYDEVGKEAERLYRESQRYAIYVSFTLSPKERFAAQTTSATDNKPNVLYKTRSECERAKKQTFGLNSDYRKSFSCELVDTSNPTSVRQR